jgi:hypothetical protein
MDPNATYLEWCTAVLSEDRARANEAYATLRAWLDRGGFEPAEWSDRPWTRRQFFAYNPTTGAIDK